MNIKTLARIADSSIVTPKKSTLKARLKQKLMDTSSTDEAIEVGIASLDEAEPAEVISSVIEVLGEVITDLQNSSEDKESLVLDSRKRTKKASKHAHISDEELKKLKTKLRKKLMDTESSEEIIDEAVDALKVMDPESVLTTVVEVLDDVVSNLE